MKQELANKYKSNKKRKEVFPCAVLMIMVMSCSTVFAVSLARVVEGKWNDNKTACAYDYSADATHDDDEACQEDDGTSRA